ncbi:S1C family serine protease [Sphingobacterium corticis]|uniref:S1C family serine protease n=1 Tax=Sphingobacterium corticis TaxID=1812823 RepID=A0ABW5NM47_9SPHI
MSKWSLQEFLEQADKYLSNELTQEERASFDAFRRENPLFEEKFVEHQKFVEQMQLHSRRADFKRSLDQVFEHEYRSPGIVKKMWNVLRINGVAAAVVAVISSLATLYSTGYFSTIKKTTSDYSALRREVNNVKRNVNAQHTAIKKINNNQNEQPTIHYGATGFLLNKNGYVVTNYHVVNDADSVHLQNRQGNSYKADIIYKDMEKDLAILHISDGEFKPNKNIPYSFRSQDLDLGDDIFTIGYPRDEAVYGEGYLSSSTGYAGDTLAYQISIPLNPGNSGGPVFDHYGNIIGIISGKQKGIDGAGFAIKTEALMNALKDIPADVLKGDVSLNDKNSMSAMSRTEQIKKVQDYIYIVKVY